MSERGVFFQREHLRKIYSATGQHLAEAGRKIYSPVKKYRSKLDNPTFSAKTSLTTGILAEGVGIWGVTDFSSKPSLGVGIVDIVLGTVLLGLGASDAKKAIELKREQKENQGIKPKTIFHRRRSSRWF